MVMAQVWGWSRGLTRLAFVHGLECLASPSVRLVLVGLALQPGRVWTRIYEREEARIAMSRVGGDLRPGKLTRTSGGQGINRKNADHEGSEKDFGEHDDREK